MGKTNVGNVADAISNLVAEMQLEKVGADVVADPGTAQPAKQDKSRSLIAAATEGSRSAENTADVKAEVPGEDIDQANPANADNKGPASSTENLTSASYVGEDPSVEKDFGSNEPDPGTSHPASVSNKNEKYSSVRYETLEDFQKAAAEILAEAEELDKSADEASDNLPEIKCASDARDFIFDHVEGIDPDGNEKTAADRSELVDQETARFIEGFAKSSSLVGILTADMLDGMAEELQKQGEGEEMLAEAGPEELMEGAIPAEALAAGAEEEGAGADEEAMALAEAAQEVAAELGISPEEVLQMAEAELAGGAGGEEAALGGEEAALGGGGGMAAAAAPDMAGGGMEVAAEVREKAAKYDALLAKQAAEKAAADNSEAIASTVTGAMDKWWSEKQAEAAAKA
jgi:hypothetical protein